MERITFELTKKLKQEIKIYCARYNISVKDFITNLIIEKLR